MYISQLSILNYKSFRKTEKIELKSGFNLITGKNNSGKTAFLECASLGIAAAPHKSLKAVPKIDSPIDPDSTLLFSMFVESEELLRFIASANTRWLLPIDPNRAVSAEKIAEEFFAAESHTFNLRCHNGQIAPAEFPSFGQGSPLPINRIGDLTKFIAVDTHGPGATFSVSGPVQGNFIDEIGAALCNGLKSRIYRFVSERRSISTCQNGNSRILNPDARNLPEVLVNLQANRSRFDRYLSYVREVLPDIKWISVENIDSSNIQIRIWSHEASTERSDLAIPLDQCGTGLGHVLAMIYVVTTAEHPTVIVVDEPNNFLHPGAVRSLVGIFKKFSQHQYVLSTHSPTVISAVSPSTVLLLRQQDFETTVESIDVSAASELSTYLSEIGARLSDVFGSDDILWVEGATEERCFPKIVELLLDRRMLGTAIVGIAHTGDLERRNAKLIFEIYERLTTSGGLLPPAIGFILDREGRSEGEIDDLKSKSRQLAEFLPRRMYENYLLDAEAIAYVLNRSLSNEALRTTKEKVADWLAQNASKPKYLSKTQQRDWQRFGDAAGILYDLFSDFSETTVEYQKVKHGSLLTDWLIANRSDALTEVIALLDAKLKSKPKNS